MNAKPLSHRERGFTLAEMAVVLVIVALMLGGLLIPLSAQRDIEARRNTTRAMETIREALLGYAVVNGRLPCPAQADIAAGAANAGVEAYDNSTCLCTATGTAAHGGTSCAGTSTVSGVLPWATLGVPESDAWNRRYTYLVTAAYARSIGQANSYCNTVPASPPANAAFALCTRGLAVVLDASVAGVPLTTADEVPAVVISHGDNGLGSWGSDGKFRNGAAGDELANADGNASFASNTSIDDMLTWISRPILMNRMIAAGKLP